MTPAERIRELRTAAKLSQEAAARQANISWATWQRVEAGKGRPTVDTIQRIAAVLGVEPGTLI